MDSTNNNYNPFQGFDPGTALTGLRNQMMDAYSGMQQQQQQSSGGMGGEGGSWGGMGGGGGGGWGNLFNGMFGGGGAGGGWGGMGGGAGIGQMPNQNNMVGMPQGYNPTIHPGAGYNVVNTTPQMPMGQPVQPQMPMGNTGGGIGGGSGAFGLPVGQGPPGGNAENWLSGLGMPIPGFLHDIANNHPTGSGNYNSVLQQLGGVGGLPSLQSLAALNPSEQQFLAGFFETVLGIPFDDVINAAQRPTAGMQTAQGGRATWQ